MIYSFGGFTLDTERYELNLEGEPVASEPKVLEVLAYLIRAEGRVVSKEELVEEVWKGRFVSDSAVSRAIREVRRALGDTAAEAQWVKTVYGRGFSFQGETVESVEESRDRLDRRPALMGTPLPIPLTSLIGRDRELAEVSEMLTRTRLLTLSGAGGAGKTRLALEVAHHSADRFPDGRLFVALAEIAEPELVVSSIARALGIGDAGGSSVLEAVQHHIAHRALLLVLDNFEHVVEARDVVVELLQSCAHLVILVTSRFVLQVVGEQEYVVPPLELPQDGQLETAIEEVPSVALFLERARALDHELHPQGRALDDLAEICRKLDGLPLAIELAAAHVKVLSIPELRNRLGERLDLLRAPSGTRPSRHQTLELALSWSHDLLDQDERGVLHRLSVFVGGFDLSAAERVCRVEGFDVLHTVTSLVDKSLVSRQPTVASHPRFGLLEITRAYARGKLDGEEELKARNAHADWVLELARRGEQHLAGGDQKAWLERLDAEYGNVLAALHWARSGGDLEVGLETAAALVRYWSARGIYREGRSELEALLAHPGIGSVEPRIRAQASTALGLLALLLGDYASARDFLERSLKLQRSLDDPVQVAHTINHLAWVNAQGYQLDRAESLSREALVLHRDNRVERGISVALNNLSWIAQVRGEVSQAEEYLAQALIHRRAAEDERGVAFLLINLAVLRLEQSNDLQGVKDWLAEARAVIEPLGDPPLLGWLLSAEGALAVRSGEAEKAIALLDRSIEISRDSGSLDGRSWGLFFKAEALRKLGRFEIARSHFEEMRELWSHLGAPSGVARALAGLAEIDRAEGKSEQARDRYRQCLEIFDRLGARRHVEACRRWLAQVEP